MDRYFAKMNAESAARPKPPVVRTILLGEPGKPQRRVPSSPPTTSCSAADWDGGRQGDVKREIFVLLIVRISFRRVAPTAARQDPHKANC